MCLTRALQKFVHARYKKSVGDDEKMIIRFLPVQKQLDTYCGLFVIAFVAEVLDGKSHIDAVFDIQNMRTHLIQILESQNLAPFPERKV